jgi:hypothetical protein
VEEALNKPHNDKSSGIDGLTYEFWKDLNQKFQMARSKNNKEEKEQIKFNPVKLLTMVFNDIHSNGLVKGTNFSVGWMCPIYKKNDRNEIANYRPVCRKNRD